jgi:hypothetical protein
MASNQEREEGLRGRVAWTAFWRIVSQPEKRKRNAADDQRGPNSNDYIHMLAHHGDDPVSVKIPKHTKNRVTHAPSKHQR